MAALVRDEGRLLAASISSLSVSVREIYVRR